MRARVGDAGAAGVAASPRSRCRSSTSSGVTRMAIETIFISYASIFLPRYSGVRPIIRPAMKTAMIANTSMPYRPEPTPPNTTSPSCISTSGTTPPSGVNESCIEFTAPQRRGGGDGGEQRRGGDAEAHLLAFHVAAGLRGARRLVDAERGELRVALLLERDRADRARRRTSPSSRPAPPSPGAGRRPCGRTRSTAPPGSGRSPASAGSWSARVGFSYGCAELALKKPPPLVPSILIASCEATGPIASVCVLPLLSSITGWPLASFSGWPSAPSLGSC